MKKNLLFLFSFLSAKGVIYIAPLLLADILTKNDFGLLEYSLAGLGMLLNTIISLGITGAYPYFILKEKKLDIIEGFAIHPLWLVVFFACNNICFYLLQLYEISIYMAGNISFIIAVQQFYSTIFKSNEKINKAVFLDAGIYILLFILVVFAYLDFIFVNILLINKILFIYAILLSFYGVYAFLKINKDGILIKYKKIVSFGVHIVISSFFLFFITVAGRILTKYFFDYETTGVYGYYFRLSAIVVLLYQVVSIRFFKDLYVKSSKILDTYYAYFIWLIFLLSIITYYLSPFVMPIISDYFSETYNDNKLVFLVIFCQMTMWVASALNSSVVDREGLTKINNLYFLLLFIFSVIFLYLIKNNITLFKLSFIIYTIHFMVNLVQLYTVTKKNIYFKKTLFSIIAIYICCSGYIFIIY